VTPRRVPDDVILQLPEARELLKLPQHTLGREARLGRLKVSRRAGRLWTTGAWLREWIEGGVVQHGRRAAVASANGSNNGGD
jgi:hypothetical protein